MKAILGFVAAIVTLVAPAASAAADEAAAAEGAAASATDKGPAPANEGIDRLDLSVPDLPAIVDLNLSTDKVVRPTTPRELATSLANGFSPDGSFHTGVAIEISPSLFLPVKYNNKYVRALRFSGATAAISSDSAADGKLAGGVRWSLGGYDPHDETDGKPLRDCLAPALPRLRPPPDEGRLPETGVTPHEDGREAAMSVAETEAMLQHCRDQARAEHLAQTALEVALVIDGTSRGSLKLQDLGAPHLSLWMSGAVNAKNSYRQADHLSPPRLAAVPLSKLDEISLTAAPVPPDQPPTDSVIGDETESLRSEYEHLDKQYRALRSQLDKRAEQTCNPELRCETQQACPQGEAHHAGDNFACETARYTCDTLSHTCETAHYNEALRSYSMRLNKYIKNFNNNISSFLKKDSQALHDAWGLQPTLMIRGDFTRVADRWKTDMFAGFRVPYERDWLGIFGEVGFTAADLSKVQATSVQKTVRVGAGMDYRIANGSWLAVYIGQDFFDGAKAFSLLSNVKFQLGEQRMYGLH